jgi:nicotinate (nicotinamide) nucleotide adenylyltransferase
MKFYLRRERFPRTVAAFPGSYHPITVAHMAVAHAALRVADEVVFVMPQRFPHKEYEQVGLEERMGLVRRAVEAEPRFSAAITVGGLFIDVARECCAAYGPDVEIYVLCGTDAAERIVNWDYGAPASFERMLDEFQMLVAARGGDYEPPQHLAGRIHPLPMDTDWSEVSATEVRRRLAAGVKWKHLVPETIHEHVERLYGSAANG